MKKKWMSLLLVLSLLAAMLLPASAAEVTADVEANTASLTGEAAREGDTVTVTLSVDQAGLTSGQLALNYDASALTLVSAEFGEAVAAQVEAEDPALINPDEAGTVTAGFASLTPAEAGALLVVTFTASSETPADGYTFTVTEADTELSTEDVDDYLKPDQFTDGVYTFKLEGSGTQPGEDDNQPGDNSGDNSGDNNGGNSGNNSGNNGGSTTNKGNGAYTGDDSPVVLLSVVLVAAAAGIVAVVVHAKRKGSK